MNTRQTTPKRLACGFWCNSPVLRKRSIRPMRARASIRDASRPVPSWRTPPLVRPDDAGISHWRAEPLPRADREHPDPTPCADAPRCNGSPIPSTSIASAFRIAGSNNPGNRGRAIPTVHPAHGLSRLTPRFVFAAAGRINEVSIPSRRHRALLTLLFRMRLILFGVNRSLVSLKTICSQSIRKGYPPQGRRAAWVIRDYRGARPGFSRRTQSFVFNCPSLAAMNARMSSDIPSSLSHCSL